LPVPTTKFKSGRCVGNFDINAKGRAVNVNVTSCPDSFYKARIENYLDWILFYPKVERGVAVETLGYKEIFEYYVASQDD
jgi:hypothetical protein